MAWAARSTGPPAPKRAIDRVRASVVGMPSTAAEARIPPGWALAPTQSTRPRATAKKAANFIDDHRLSGELVSASPVADPSGRTRAVNSTPTPTRVGPTRYGRVAQATSGEIAAAMMARRAGTIVDAATVPRANATEWLASPRLRRANWRVTAVELTNPPTRPAIPRPRSAPTAFWARQPMKLTAENTSTSIQS